VSLHISVGNAEMHCQRTYISATHCICDSNVAGKWLKVVAERQLSNGRSMGMTSKILSVQVSPERAKCDSGGEPGWRLPAANVRTHGPVRFIPAPLTHEYFVAPVVVHVSRIALPQIRLRVPSPYINLDIGPVSWLAVYF